MPRLLTDSELRLPIRFSPMGCQGRTISKLLDKLHMAAYRCYRSDTLEEKDTCAICGDFSGSLGLYIVWEFIQDPDRRIQKFVRFDILCKACGTAQRGGLSQFSPPELVAMSLAHFCEVNSLTSPADRKRVEMYVQSKQQWARELAGNWYLDVSELEALLEPYVPDVLVRQEQQTRRRRRAQPVSVQPKTMLGKRRLIPGGPHE